MQSALEFCLQECDDWGKENYCNSNPRFMWYACRKTCSSCFRPDLQVCFHPCAKALSMQQPYNWFIGWQILLSDPRFQRSMRISCEAPSKMLDWCRAGQVAWRAERKQTGRSQGEEPLP